MYIICQWECVWGGLVNLILSLSLVDDQEPQGSSHNDYLIYHSYSSLGTTNSCVQISIDISGTKPNDEKSREE